MRGGSGKRSVRGVKGMVALAAIVAMLVVAPAALAHIERASYWPNPGVDTAGGVPTGGAVPDTKPLFTALDRKPVGDTRVVCQGKVPKRPKKGAGRAANRKYKRRINKNKSIKRLDKRIDKVVYAKKKKNRGYILRPSEERIKVGKKAAKKLRKFNVRLLKRCKYDSIQDAVNASGNNDRVVIMPGVYTEPESRSAPTNDPRCDGLEETNDRGQTGALSYKYQATCPNDQSLITVIGREVSGTPPPQPPLLDRHNLPDEGPCIRCNLQMEGSGLTPDDVVIDAGNVASGNGAPADPVKDVVIRVDRGDGFVGRNFNLRHAAEHGIYLIETDGYRVEQFKALYNEEYGLLTFTADHALIQNCDAAGSGDSGLYPGAAPDTGEQTIESTQRYNTEIRFCDMRHNTAGYSGTDANAVWMHHNDLYDNANGFTTDVFTAAGHPGFPQDSDLIENNEFYSNNFNPYLPGSDVIPITTMPVGTGLWIAGGNNNTIRNNHFWDNWRRGIMLFSVPDAFACDNPSDQVPGCTPGDVSTSYRNRFYGNKMGQDPSGRTDPNGLDFWWDQQGTQPTVSNTANCWYDNTGRDGTAASITSLPDKNGVPPDNLPSDCGNAPAPGGLHGQTAELLGCILVPDTCAWFTTPPEPQ
ncbi:MAG: NosD domain-containing protein [Solirubrobacterales bacterium]